MDKKEIKYIAERYKSERFSTDKAWSSMGFRRLSWWTVNRAAAAIVLAVGLTATAAIVINRHLASPEDETGQETVVPDTAVSAVKVIDFEDTALPEVIKQIKKIYGIEIENIPENASDYKLSLHYEGNVENLVATINEILDIQLSVKKK